MSRSWLLPAGVVVLFCLPALGRGDPPALGPPEQLNTLPQKIDLSDNSIELPPQTFDGSSKAPNNVREPKGTWSISGGIFIIEPVFVTNPALLVNAAGGNVVRQTDFRYHLDVAPAVWIGYVSERGWGLRGRWFMFDRDASESYATAPGETVQGISSFKGGQTPVSGSILTSSNLYLNVFDVQATYTHYQNKWTFLEGFGVRYAHLSQGYQAVLDGTNPLNGMGTHIDLGAGHTFDGAGPSFSFEAKHRLGEKGFSLYGNLTGAILFGTLSESSSAVNNGVLQDFARSHTSVMPVGETEIGGEYCRNMGRAKLFIRTGFLGQVWGSGGNATNLDPIGPSSATNHSFGFVGLAVRAGVRY